MTVSKETRQIIMPIALTAAISFTGNMLALDARLDVHLQYIKETLVKSEQLNQRQELRLRDLELANALLTQVKREPLPVDVVQANH